MFLEQLKDLDIILASTSPRRKQLLEDAGLTFRILSKNIEENFPVYLQRADIPLYLSKIKAHSIKTDYPDSLIIAADTIVVQRNRVLNKPASPEEATSMLKLLSGSMHEVITGVTLSYKNTERSFFDITEVHFKQLPDGYIDYYINTYKPFDKAGSYGIQEWIGMVGIKKIQGDYFNVMGLPVSRLVDELECLLNPGSKPLNSSSDSNNPNKYLYFG